MRRGPTHWPGDWELTASSSGLVIDYEAEGAALIASLPPKPTGPLIPPKPQNPRLTKPQRELLARIADAGSAGLKLSRTNNAEATAMALKARGLVRGVYVDRHTVRLTWSATDAGYLRAEGDRKRAATKAAKRAEAGE